MAKNEIQTTIVPQDISFTPGTQPALLTVKVVNESDLFASFQIELNAAGTSPNAKRNWYSISPEVSSKKPPGDSTEFQVKILESPIQGFVGLMNITVRIFSMELPDEDRQIIRLDVKQGTLAIPLKVTMPIHEFKAMPNEAIAITVEVYNPSQLETHAIIQLHGLDPSWITPKERRIAIDPGVEEEISFSCQLPSTTETLSQTYPFEIEATHSHGPPSKIEATLDINPQGIIAFECEEKQKRIPEKRPWLPGWKVQKTHFLLNFNNQSNLKQTITVGLRNEKQPKCQIEYDPPELELLPGESQPIEMHIKARRRLGLPKTLLLETEANLSDRRLGSATPDAQNLRLKVIPMIPLWLILLSIPAILYAIWSALWLNPNNVNWGHQGAVNSVQLNGVAEQIATGSNDQTIRKWNSGGFFNPILNPEIGSLGDPQKAVRVVRYRPVDNNVVAIGLENGEIQLLTLLEQPNLLKSFVYRKDDRVLDLEFTRNSRFLYSGHGSGLILLWDVDVTVQDIAQPDENPEPLGFRQMDFAVYDLALVTPEENVLAIAGRYNQLVLWNLQTNQMREVSYPSGSKDDYIFSLDSASLKPGLMASADNQGNIVLWDLTRCLQTNRTCEILDQWSDGHGEQPVRSVALSDDGCYLASGGDDGKVILWPLTASGTRTRQYPKGIPIAESYPKKVGGFFGQKVHPKINSVDVRTVKNWVYVASGSDDTQVRLQRHERVKLGCDNLSPSN